jgi:hypothetical protein
MPSHPIARRLEVLAAQWANFTSNPEARLLRWQCLPDEVPVVETFVAREADSDACFTPDVFLRFDDAFEHATAHGHVLRKTLLAALDEARPALDEGELEPSTGHDDVGAFAALLLAYFEHLAEVDHVVAFLSPDEVKDTSAYQAWLQRLAHACPEQVRVVVLEDAAAPFCEVLAKSEPTRIETISCNLGMQGAFEAMASNANDGSPGANFRELLVRIGGRAKEGDVASASSLARAATDLALTMQCPHLAAGVQMLLASVHASVQQPIEALTCYAEVDRLGQATHAIGDHDQASAASELRGDVAKVYGLRLRRDARLGQGAVLIGQQAWRHAGTVYVEAASLSKALQEPLAELDGLRLASFCHEQQGKREDAWQCGMAGLEVGAGMDEETRRGSTLGYLGESMLRMTHSSSHSAYREAIGKHMEKLLGPAWREAPAP